ALKMRQLSIWTGVVKYVKSPRSRFWSKARARKTNFAYTVPTSATESQANVHERPTPGGAVGRPASSPPVGTGTPGRASNASVSPTPFAREHGSHASAAICAAVIVAGFSVA